MSCLRLTYPWRRRVRQRLVKAVQGRFFLSFLPSSFSFLFPVRQAPGCRRFCSRKKRFQRVSRAADWCSFLFLTHAPSHVHHIPVHALHRLFPVRHVAQHTDDALSVFEVDVNFHPRLAHPCPSTCCSQRRLAAPRRRGGRASLAPECALQLSRWGDREICFFLFVPQTGFIHMHTSTHALEVFLDDQNLGSYARVRVEHGGRGIHGRPPNA